MLLLICLSFVEPTHFYKISHTTVFWQGSPPYPVLFLPVLHLLYNVCVLTLNVSFINSFFKAVACKRNNMLKSKTFIKKTHSGGVLKIV
ncbi:hypothetical protein XELAEV_18015722mg [Xenopus laevis]|uniref:Uncharacterized protein n=1 Tax=Xenopus laevis TaxID=8355 RepID=A0A974DIJ9_XENLA|nr:hypothetical protein XELAEV_18015722mg [Xenopus laevis]